jgi:hypothetical protein
MSSAVDCIECGQKHVRLDFIGHSVDLTRSDFFDLMADLFPDSDVKFAFRSHAE